MNDLEKAARMAMEAICGSGDFLFNFHDCEPNNEREMQAYQAALAANEKAFNALRQALEQPQDEWLTGCPECGMDGECGCDKTIAMMKGAQEAAVLAEREACAQLADEAADNAGDPYCCTLECRGIAEAIRARGQA